MEVETPNTQENVGGNQPLGGQKKKNPDLSKQEGTTSLRKMEENTTVQNIPQKGSPESKNITIQKKMHC